MISLPADVMNVVKIECLHVRDDGGKTRRDVFAKSKRKKLDLIYNVKYRLFTMIIADIIIIIHYIIWLMCMEKK